MSMTLRGQAKVIIPRNWLKGGLCRSLPLIGDKPRWWSESPELRIGSAVRWQKGSKSRLGDRLLREGVNAGYERVIGWVLRYLAPCPQQPRGVSGWASRGLETPG